MTKNDIPELIRQKRRFMLYDQNLPEDYETDQQQKLPQPPLTKAPMREEAIRLPHNFETLPLKSDFLAIINGRHSSRVYSGERMSLLELSWLLWATQGVKSIRGRKYATIRTVPCGGARHEFECYFFLKNTEALEDGLYHYLPMEHAIERLFTRTEVEEKENKTMEELIGSILHDQSWGAKANVVFCYSMVAYRMEWRYGPNSHNIALIDVGHISENLYLAAEALDMGTCGVGSIRNELADRLFTLDGAEEFMFYSAVCGKVKPHKESEEKAFYAFVDEEGY